MYPLSGIEGVTTKNGLLVALLLPTHYRSRRPVAGGVGWREGSGGA